MRTKLPNDCAIAWHTTGNTTWTPLESSILYPSTEMGAWPSVEALSLGIISTRACNALHISLRILIHQAKLENRGGMKDKQRECAWEWISTAEGAAHITSGTHIDTFLEKLSRWSNALLFSEKELGVQILEENRNS